jgi:hypothetical protein
MTCAFKKYFLFFKFLYFLKFITCHKWLFLQVLIRSKKKSLYLLHFPIWFRRSQVDDCSWGWEPQRFGSCARLAGRREDGELGWWWHKAPLSVWTAGHEGMAVWHGLVDTPRCRGPTMSAAPEIPSRGQIHHQGYVWAYILAAECLMRQ